MRAGPAVLLAAVIGLAVPAAAAQPRGVGDDGLVIAVRVGWGLPFGDVSRDPPALAVKEVAEAKMPFSLDLGYRFNRRVWGEIFFELAPARVADGSCAASASCSASDVRIGVAMQLHLAPAATFDPWIGLGVGVEVLSTEADVPTGGRIESSWAGFELPFVEAGVDVAVNRWFSLGPYGSASFAQFTSAARRPEGGTTARDSIADRASHGWTQLGLKATLRL